MTLSKARFDFHIAECNGCLDNFDNNGGLFALRYVWIASVSAFDLYMSELIAEVGIRLIDRTPPKITSNIRAVHVPLENALYIEKLSPAEKLLFFKVGTNSFPNESTR